MFAWPATIAFLNASNPNVGRRPVAYILLFFVFVILIGLRYETGGDWFNYKDYSDGAYFRSFSSLLDDYEFGFSAITWLSTRLDWDVYGTMTFCGAVLMFGLLEFCRKTPYTWLGITAAVPYLIIVLAMGYVRQGAAIGFILMALTRLEQGSRWKFGLYVIVATLFHVSALVLLPFFMIALARRNIAIVIPIIIGSIPAIYFLSGTRYDRMVDNYIGAQYSSSGALIRLFMNIVPSILFLAYRNRFRISDNMRSIWTILSVSSIILLFFFFISPSSTVVDRIGLYLIPIQIFVFSSLPEVAARQPSEARFISVACILYFATIQFVWLNYADNSFAWLPYRSLLTS